MKRSGRIAAMLVAALAVAAPATAKAPPANWDGLALVKPDKLELVYLQPGADFRGYAKIMLDPTEVAFHKDWRRNQNSSTRSLGSQVSERDVQRAVNEGVAAATDIFAKAWQKAGYPVVDSPGPDVLRVSTAVLNIQVSAPDKQSAGRSYSFSDTAGSAQFVIEVRDSTTNALLGRVVDGQIAGDSTIGWRSSVSNRGDFRQLVEDWAKLSVNGLTRLKSLPPASQ